VFGKHCEYKPITANKTPWRGLKRAVWRATDCHATKTAETGAAARFCKEKKKQKKKTINQLYLK